VTLASSRPADCLLQEGNQQLNGRPLSLAWRCQLNLQQGKFQEEIRVSSRSFTSISDIFLIGATKRTRGSAASLWFLSKIISHFKSRVHHLDLITQRPEFLPLHQTLPIRGLSSLSCCIILALNPAFSAQIGQAH